MDVNQFFSGGAGDAIKNPQKKISLVRYLNAKPLVYGLEKKADQHPFEMTYDVPAICAEKLIDGEADFSMIPSIEYAKGKGEWRIAPNLCISSNGPVTSVNLFFNPQKRDVRKIAIDSSSRTSVILLKIILQEKYRLNPEYIVMEPDLEKMFSVADAALIIGDLALYEHGKNDSFLDLGEEWSDLTGLPFVFAFWAGKKNEISLEDITHLQKSYEVGAQHITEISKEYAQRHKNGWERYHRYLTEEIQYNFGHKEQEGLQAFYRYAFYYGFIDHIPDLHFYEKK
jgi:chorismate dehydratase